MKICINQFIFKKVTKMDTKIERITRGRETKSWNGGDLSNVSQSKVVPNKSKPFSLSSLHKQIFSKYTFRTIGYLLHDLLSFAFTAVLMVVNHVLRYCFPAKDATHNVEVMQIISRHKTDEMKLPSIHDFHAIHQRWTTASELLSPNWMIYTMNHATVTFVRMPHSELQYQSKQAPFLYYRQHSDAEYVATMNIQTFLDFGAQIGKPKDKVLLISNSGRCGSTLLAQLLQIDGLTASFSEPDIFFALGVQIQDNAFKTMTIRNYAPLLRSIVNVLCKNQTVGTSYVFKSRCFCNALLPIVAVAVPEVEHIFLYRGDINKGCQSMAKSFMTRNLLHGLYMWKPLGIELLDRLWISGSSVEKVALRGVKPRTLWEYGATVFAVQYAYFLDHIARDDSVMKVKYENLLGETAGELTRIYELMQWPLEHISHSLDCMRNDSQEESPLSRKELAKYHWVSAMPLTPQRSAEMEYILRLPTGFFNIGFQFDHNIYYER